MADELRFVRVPSTMFPGEPWLVLKTESGSPIGVPKMLCDMLRCCDGARTLSGHAAEVEKRLGIRGPKERALVSRGLSELRRMGLLLGEGALATLGEQPVCDPPEVTTIVVLTHERPEACRRLIDSLLPRLASRCIDLIICDDSSSAESISAYRTLASEVAARHGHRVALIDRAAKRSFVAHVESLTGDAALVTALRFGLEGTADHGRAAGANRNAALLATLGRAFVSMDDDTVARFSRTGVTEGPLQVCGAYDATAFRYFRSAGCLTEHTRFEPDLDPIAIHGALLGATPTGALRTAGGVRAVGFNDGLFATLNRADARVAVTSTGVAGDSGMGNPSYALFPRDPSFRALTGEPERYAEYLTTRHVVRGVERPTLSSGNLLMMPCVGLDNTSLLPPCSPAFRNEDGVFAQTLRLTQPGSLVGHLPWAVAHEPVEPRAHRRKDVVRVRARYEVAHLLAGALNIAAPRHAHGSAAARTRALGAGLGCVGEGSAVDLRGLTRRLCSAQWGNEIRLLGEGLRTRGSSVPHWAKDAKARIASLQETLGADRISLAGVPQGGSDAYDSAARYLRQFGQLLQLWPDIVAVATELDGQRRGLLDCAV